MRRFEELRVWADARDLVGDVYKMMASCKDYGFRDQIQRATISIMNNIAEGSEMSSDKAFIRYLRISKASCAEVRSMLYLCEDLKICDPATSEQLKRRVMNIAGALFRLIESLDKGTNV